MKKKTKVKSDVFRADGLGARESQEEGETEYDIFLSDDMDDNAIHTQNGRKVSVPRHIKQKSMKKAKTMGNWAWCEGHIILRLLNTYLNKFL